MCVQCSFQWFIQRVKISLFSLRPWWGQLLCLFCHSGGVCIVVVVAHSLTHNFISPNTLFFVCFGPPVKFYLIREKLFSFSLFIAEIILSLCMHKFVWERYRITFTCWLFDCTQNGRNYSAGGSRLHVKVACTSNFHCHGFQLSLWPSFNEHAD